MTEEKEKIIYGTYKKCPQSNGAAQGTGRQHYRDAHRHYGRASKKSGDGDGYKEKYEKEHKDFEDYKNSITAEKTQAAKEKAARAYFESKSIKGDNLDIAMMGIEGRLAALELDGEKLKDTKSLDELIGGKYAKLVTKEDVKGADVKNPPATGGDTKTEPVSLADALRQKYKESADKQ